MKQVPVLDHVITSEDINALRALQTCGLSDHKVQIVTLGCYPSTAPSRSYKVRSFRKCNWDELRETLQPAPWHVMSVYNDMDDKWRYFYALLQECLNSFLPLKTVTSQKSKKPTP